MTSKNDLIKWLEDNAPRKAIANALLEGTVELLGVFYPVPKSIFKLGQILKIKSKRGMEWYVVITQHRVTGEWNTYTISKKDIIWENRIE